MSPHPTATRRLPRRLPRTRSGADAPEAAAGGSGGGGGEGEASGGLLEALISPAVLRQQLALLRRFAKP